MLSLVTPFVHHNLDRARRDETTMPPQMLLLLVLVLPFVALFSFVGKQIVKTSKQRNHKKQADGHGLRLPPSPPGLPLIGHLHLVGFLPHVSLRDLAGRYARDGLMLLRLGSVPTLVVSSRRAAEAVMRTHDHVLAWRPPSTVAHTLLYGSLDVIFSGYGDHWRQAKTLLTSHLLTVRKVRSYRAVREEEARLALAKVSDAATAASGKTTLDMSQLLYAFTFDVMCRAVSGRIVQLNGMSRRFRELLDVTESLVGGFNAEDYFPWLLRVGVFKRAVCARANTVRKRWDELLDRVIDDHEGKLEQQEEPDFIEVLLSHQHEYGLTRDHLKALLIDIFIAGTDTSYLVLEFAMAELVRNPRVMSRLQNEVRHGVHSRHEMLTEDDLTSMAYLKAVIKETLRLHPPAPLLAPHYSVTETHIDGCMVPAKTPILINAWALGRDTIVWPDAEEFKPERFMDTGSEASVNFKGTNFQFLPFGAGRRMCPGINFSLSSIEIMLANLVYRFNWEAPAGIGKTSIDMTEVVWLTLRRKEKLLLVPKTVGV